MKNGNKDFKKISKKMVSLLMCLTFIFTTAAQVSVSAAAGSHRRTSGSIISEEEAIGYACKDIGVNPEDAEILTTELVYEYGLYAYKICLAAGGVKYLYNIGVFDGSVIRVYSYTITYKNKTTVQQAE